MSPEEAGTQGRAEAAKTTDAGEVGSVDSGKVKAVGGAAKTKRGDGAAKQKPADNPYLRAANEDDDGYDPYSDRPASPEPLFERDPWS